MKTIAHSYFISYISSHFAEVAIITIIERKESTTKSVIEKFVNIEINLRGPLFRIKITNSQTYDRLVLSMGGRQ